MTRRSLVSLLALGVLAATVLVACGSFSSSGPDLVGGVEGSQSVAAMTDPADLTQAEGSDRAVTAEGTPSVVAGKVSGAVGDPRDSVVEKQSIFYLYRSGTIWVTDSAEPGRSLIVIYNDNEQATRRHSLLAASIGWNATRRGFSTGGGRNSGSGNGFRGGGSGSGK